ncbi:Ni/Fe hydrogenase subunit alpha, partial [Pseudomonas sp. AB12(2023)]|nr:Ni/Fe hydrogenase subunit alpha [Pseudomonas sp. AB12(2023)]
LGHYAQQLQSHATAYFYCIVPEMVLGMDAAPEKRNVLGLATANPELIKRVVMLRKWGQELIQAVLGKKMHGISSIPGGVNNNLTAEARDRFI